MKMSPAEFFSFPSVSKFAVT